MGPAPAPRLFNHARIHLPAPVIALIGATLIYIVWQIPAVGAIGIAAVVAYALGAVVTARLDAPAGGTTA